MTSRPVLLDLFCGAGGAAMGYYRAGFDVIGVDKRPQPRYPFRFIQADAVVFAADFDWSQVAAVHASPPCQYGTRGAKQCGTQDRHKNLIPATREILARSGRPYVIENNEDNAADLVNPIILCGDMFGLDVFRHRAFEIGDFGVLASPHVRHTGHVGDGRYVTVTGKPGGRSRRDGVQHGRLADWQRAMGIDWMTAREMAQAIPPAYTQFIGEQLMAHLTAGVTS